MSKKSRILLFFLVLLPSWAVAFSPLNQLKVESEWGDASSVDVKTVLDSTSQVIASYVGRRSLGIIIVRNDPKGPISLYERGPNNEYIVLLDVKGRYWAQLAYQFSHEVCHLLTNYDLAPNNVTRQQWFEESVCEAFSLFVLKRMAEQWEVNPPYPNWRSYAKELEHYADDMLSQEHRGFAPDLRQWYQQHKQTLESNPYANDRHLNEKFATHILELMTRQPEQWAALNYVNLGDNTGDNSFAKYLNDWHRNTPVKYQQLVVKMQQILQFHTGTQ